MRKLPLATLTLIAVASQATAADLRTVPAPFPRPAAPVAVPLFTWSGFSAGVHGAWITSDVSAIRTRSPVLPELLPTRVNFDDSSFGGGAQIGYSLQFGSIVAGLDADITATGIDRARTVSLNPPPFATTSRFSSTMDFFGTVKGRLGVAFPSILPFAQQSMVYVTGGLGYADVDNRARVSVAIAGGAQVLAFGGRSDDIKAGFVVGGGTESAITDTISLKTETLYYNLEDDKLALRRGGLRYNYRIENDGWISRVGVNVKIGAP
jgi:outer membrane immunogenic protein